MRGWGRSSPKADGDADGAIAGPVTDTRMSDGVLPSVDRAPCVGVTTSRSSRYWPGCDGATSGSPTAAVPPGAAAVGSSAFEVGAGTGSPSVETHVPTRRAAVREVRSQISSESDSAGGVVDGASQPCEPALTTRTPTVSWAPVASEIDVGAPKAAVYEPPTRTRTELTIACVGAS